MALYFYNTLTQKVEEFAPADSLSVAVTSKNSAAV